MSVVHLQAIEILNASAAFADPYIFKITFECISELQEDIEWKLIYVGSAEDEKYDQELDNCLVGPVPVGVNSFEFEAASPSPSKIPAQDLLGVTVILLTGSYKDQEFIRVGYYVNNEYQDLEMRENPPEKVDLTLVKREVLVSKPRVTRFNIKWDTDSKTAPEDTTALGGSSEGIESSLGSSSAIPPPASSASSANSTGAVASTLGATTSTTTEGEAEIRPGEDEEAASGVGAGSSFKPAVKVSS